MSPPPIRKDLQGLLQDHQERIDLVERRLGKGGTGSSVPYDANPGMIMPYAGAVAPEGWLFCDGSAVSRTTYATLYSAIGTAYGVGDGSTTFNLPNLKGRVPVGKDATQAEFDVIGEAGGAKTVTLTIDQMPSHAHQWQAAGTNNPGAAPANWDDIVGGNTNALGTGPTNPEIPDLSGGNAIKPRGGGQAHTNLQPYVVTNYIISTGDGTGGGGKSGGDGGSAPPSAGLVSPWAGADTAVPSGWLLCDGRIISRAGYPALFAAIGVTYGAGDGSTTFNVPNYKGRTLVGRDPGQAEFDVLGETGGEKAHVLTRPELPNDNGVRMTWGQGNISFSGNPQAAATPPSGNGLGTWQNDPAYDSDAANTGQNLPHNNLQPYAVANYIIATGAASTGSNAPAVLPVQLWQEFTLDLAGALTQPINGGAVVWSGPVSGNLGATLDATKTTIRLPEAGTYKIITHLGYYATTGNNVSGVIYLAGTALDRTNSYGVTTSANVFNADVEITVTVNGPTTFTQGVSTASVYRWSWVRIEKQEPLYANTVLGVQQGSTVQRDALYGVPTTDAARASLANRAISWFNTDRGWFESYYALNTIAGVNSGRKVPVSGWYPISGNLPVCSMMRTTAQSMANGQFAYVNFDYTFSNPYGMWSSGAPSRITITVAGSYQISGAGATVGNTGRQGIIVKRNGGDLFGNLVGSGGPEIGGSASFVADLAAGDYIELTIYQETGSAQNTSTSGYARPFLSLKYLGPPVNG